MITTCLYRFIVFMIIVTAGLVSGQNKGGYWPFDDSADDVAGWDQTDDNGVLQTQAEFRNDFSLPGSDGYLWLDTLYQHDCILVPDSPDLDFTDENLGISAWIFPVRIGDDVHYILNKGDQYPNPKTTNYALRLSKSSKLEFLIRDASNKAQTVASSFTVAAGQWSFVAVYCDFSGGIIYLWNDPSGPPKDTLVCNHSFFANDDPLTIGSWYTSDPDMPSTKDFEGGIDDVMISSRMQDVLSGPITSIHETGNVPGPDDIVHSYPNPFNTESVIEFHVSEACHVIVEVLNIRGQRIMVLVDRTLDAGWHRTGWNATKWQSGTYFCRLRSRNQHVVHKMLLLK